MYIPNYIATSIQTVKTEDNRLSIQEENIVAAAKASQQELFPELQDRQQEQEVQYDQPEQQVEEPKLVLEETKPEETQPQVSQPEEIKFAEEVQEKLSDELYAEGQEQMSEVPSMTSSVEQEQEEQPRVTFSGSPA